MSIIEEKNRTTKFDGVAYQQGRCIFELFSYCEPDRPPRIFFISSCISVLLGDEKNIKKIKEMSKKGENNWKYFPAVSLALLGWNGMCSVVVN